MSDLNRLELTAAETQDLVRRGIGKGRRRLAGRRALTGISAVTLVGALGVGVISIVGPSSDVAPGDGPGTPPAPVPGTPTQAPSPTPVDPTPTPEPPQPSQPNRAERASEMFETLTTLLPAGMELSDFSAARVADNPGRWVSFTLSNGSLSAPGDMLIGPEYTYGDPANCVSPMCTLTPVAGGDLMHLDGAADGKPGTPASWTFIDQAGRQVTIFVRETHGLIDSATATAIVSADAWIPLVEDEAANPTR